MRLIFRLNIFLVVLIFYIASSAFFLPTTGVEFMQVQTKVQAFPLQSSESVFTYDNGVMKTLSKCKYNRFSIKTTAGEEIVKQLKSSLIFKEEVNGDTVEYYYSPLLENYVVVQGEKINLQVAKNGDIFTIGYPMIDVGF